MSEEKVLTLRGKKAVWAPGGGSGPIDPKRLPEGYPYKEQSETVVLPEKVVTLADFSGKYISSETATFSLVPGNTYKVIWDGKTYFMECKGYSVSGLTIPYFGNFSLISPSGENTGEDFCIAIGQGNLFQCVGPAAGDYVVAISEYSETIHPMAPEFLPAGVGGGVQTVEFVMDASGSALTSALTGNEIIELAAKQPIIGRVSREGQPAENTASTFLIFDGALLRIASSSTIYAAFSVTLLDGSVLTKQYYLVPLDGTAVEVYTYPIAKSEN